MKRIYISILVIGSMLACKNSEIVHPDYDYTAGYFPYQYPVRTLILGDDIYDNSNDNAHKFLISAAMGGVYENVRDRNLEIALDESLCADVLFGANGDTIRALPSAYYTLSSDKSLIIPQGKFNGGIEVQLTEAFFDDPKAISLNYVVPLRIINSPDLDSIVVGASSISDADPRIGSQWITVPKNFTMFGIKYINEFHGNYFFYGKTSVEDADGELLDQKEYKATFVEQNGVTLLKTTGRYQVAYNTSFQSDLLSGDLKLLLDFEGNQCTVTAESDDFIVSGTGEFKTGAFEWGNKSRNGIELKYTIVKDGNIYTAEETLVTRDRAVVMEIYSPYVTK